MSEPSVAGHYLPASSLDLFHQKAGLWPVLRPASPPRYIQTNGSKSRLRPTSQVTRSAGQALQIPTPQPRGRQLHAVLSRGCYVLRRGDVRAGTITTASCDRLHAICACDDGDTVLVLGIFSIRITRGRARNQTRDQLYHTRIVKTGKSPPPWHNSAQIERYTPTNRLEASPRLQYYLDIRM